jgi:hypothetical protein
MLAGVVKRAAAREWLLPEHEESLPRAEVIDFALVASASRARSSAGKAWIRKKSFLILATPIFLPVVLKLGYDPVWFGVVVSVITMIGIIIPPVAINAFVVSGVTRVPVSVIYKGIYPFIVGMTICLIVFILFPQISLWLPNMLMK